MIKHPPHLVNGLKLLEDVGMMEDIDISVRGEGKTYEQIVQDLYLRGVSVKDMYFRGISWEEIDLFSGDVTALIPYYAYRMLLWQRFNDNNLILTNILNIAVKDARLRNIILEEVYKGE